MGPKMETEIKQKIIKWDTDSPVERNPQKDGQEGVEANIPRVASTINRLQQEQKKLSGAVKRKLLWEKKKAAGQANTDTGSKQQPEQTDSTSESRLGLDQGLLKESEIALECLLLLKSNLQRDTELYLRCLIKMHRRTSRWPSSGKIPWVLACWGRYQRYSKWDTAECRWGQTWRTSTSPQNLLSDLFLW